MTHETTAPAPGGETMTPEQEVDELLREFQRACESAAAFDPPSPEAAKLRAILRNDLRARLLSSTPTRAATDDDTARDVRHLELALREVEPHVRERCSSSAVTSLEWGIASLVSLRGRLSSSPSSTTATPPLSEQAAVQMVADYERALRKLDRMPLGNAEADQAEKVTAMRTNLLARLTVPADLTGDAEDWQSVQEVRPQRTTVA
jgi:hypothetical protein